MGIIKKSLKRAFKLLVLSTIVLISIYLISSYNFKNNLEKKCEYVEEKLTTISELSTVKYNYSNIISIKNSLKYKDFIIPFTQKSFVIKYNGFINAGVDLSKAKVSVEKNNLIVNLPPSTILNHTVNEEEIFVFDESSSAFNKLNMKDMLKEIISEKEKTESNLIKEGFLEKVDTDTIKFLENFFKELGYTNIYIKINKG